MASFYSTLIADLCFLELNARITSWDSVSNYLIYIRAWLLLNMLKIALVRSLRRVYGKTLLTVCGGWCSAFRQLDLLSFNNSFICPLCLLLTFIHVKVFP